MKRILLYLCMTQILVTGCATGRRLRMKPEAAKQARPAAQKQGSTSAVPTFYGRFGGKPVQVVPTQRVFPMRGVWVATVKNLDMKPVQSADAYRKETRRLFERIAAHQMNAVFFQVRSWNDAYYPSALNPWSRWLTGTEGRGIPGLDPLQVALDEAHARHIQFHAWLNPYRVCEAKSALTKKQALAELAPDNFARRHPQYVLRVPMGNSGTSLLLLDPGQPAVRIHIRKTVEEILKRYPVDGIHLDDYFYPYQDIGDLDSATAARNRPRTLSLEDWRRRNVDALIQELSACVKAHAVRSGRPIAFGVSPFGIWANREHTPDGSQTAGLEGFHQLYADSRKWMREQWVDYVVPQLYWSFSNQNAAFAGLVEWWAQQAKATGVSLYIGMGLHHAAPGGAWHGTAEFRNQLEFIKAYPQVKGALVFRAAFLDSMPPWNATATGKKEK